MKEEQNCLRGQPTRHWRVHPIPLPQKAFKFVPLRHRHQLKIYAIQVPDFVRNCLSKIGDPDSAEGLRALKGAAYLVAAMKVYHGPPSLSANPLKGGIRATAEKMGVQV